MEQRIRILAGQHKKGRVAFAPHPGLRPTSHRTRATVFNILIHRFFPEAVGCPPEAQLAGKTVLDLFAGTGAYGFEALSRGASHITFVDAVREYLTRIERQAQQWGKREAIDICPCVLPGPLPHLKADLVFMDPPYEMPDTEVEAVLESLIKGDALHPDALIILERPLSTAAIPHTVFRRPAQRSQLFFLRPPRS